MRPQHQGRSSTSRGHLRSSTPSTNHSNSGGSSNGNAERGGRQRQRPYQDSQVNAAAQVRNGVRSQVMPGWNAHAGIRPCHAHALRASLMLA